MPRPKSINPNPIVDQLKDTGGIVKLAGYVGRGPEGRVELYSDLSMSSSVEIADADILHVIDGEKPTEPSLVFVRKGARVTTRFETTAEATDAYGFPTCDCGGQSVGVIAAEKRPKPGSTGNRDLDCTLERAKCMIEAMFEPDPNTRTILEQACENRYNRCLAGPIGGSGGGRVIY